MPMKHLNATFLSNSEKEQHNWNTVDRAVKPALIACENMPQKAADYIIKKSFQSFTETFLICETKLPSVWHWLYLV